MSTPLDNAVTRFLRLIRFSHTIFALPFALGALLVAARGRPGMRVSILVIACMVLARTAAMLFNRLIDWSIDQKNPRTATRHLLVSKMAGWVLLLFIACGVFLGRAPIYFLTPRLGALSLPRLFFFFVLHRVSCAHHS